jgi:hypothetical protein
LAHGSAGESAARGGRPGMSDVILNEGYHDLLAGKNIRGVIIHES